MFGDRSVRPGLEVVQDRYTGSARSAQLGEGAKTRKSRQVALSDSQFQVLRDQRKLVKERQVASGVWTDTDLVFPDRFGQLRDSRNLRRLVVRFYPDWNFGFHALRRWFASYGLLDSAASNVQMARLMGHSKTNMTKDVYGKRLAEGALRIVESIHDAAS